MKEIQFNIKKFKADRREIMTGDELSKKSGLPLTTIQNIESGRKKTYEDECKLLCDTLGLNYRDYVPYKRPICIVFAANKGGAGKTTDVVSVAASLVLHYHKKVLVIDTDLQQNTTLHLGMLLPTSEDLDEIKRINHVTEESKTKNIYEAFIEKDDICNHIQHTKFENLDIVVSSDAMSTIDQEMPNLTLREYRMRDILANVVNNNPYDYDFILFDCNPTLSMFNEAVLFACDYLIVPMEASPFGLRGIQYVINFYMKVKNYQNNLNLLGIVLNKYDTRKNITKDITNALKESNLLDELVFESKIPVDTNIENSQNYGEPVVFAFPKTKASLAFKNLTGEILERIKAHKEIEKEV